MNGIVRFTVIIHGPCLADWKNYLPKFWQLVPPSEAESAEAGATSKAEAVLA